MNVDQITLKGVGELNEDSIIINNDISVYGVADGVSSLIPFKNKEGHTGGYIASNEARRYFESLEASNGLMDDLLKINEGIRNKMKAYNIDFLKKEQFWGTALAVIKVSDTGVDFVQTGDCMILAVYQDNEVRPLTRLQVAHLENTAIVKWKELIRQGIETRDDLMENVREILLSNRTKSNTFNGYGVLNGEYQALDYIEYGRINRLD
ncbi:protein phosphatase 2C domain-containing protein [Lederbergia panacisoli]|uniref:protein phosphatase 2C domain-containing protein n=1 Tax=Lederbergia panacisoli TaxID=1255251 RepID=UPI00214C01E4|nr:protein phosphatase 2C domain-containing protein [Lederbergia panacisoli]MCR2822113.1 protein phosphatase 2C domain-containing protein [Lederbergia panacisoli]